MQFGSAAPQEVTDEWIARKNQSALVELLPPSLRAFRDFLQDKLILPLWIPSLRWEHL